MQYAIDLAIAVAAWSVVVAKHAAIRDPDRRARMSWLFLLVLALAITFQVDQLYLTIGALTGIGNLAWFGSFFLMTFGFQFLVVASKETFQESVPRSSYVLVGSTAVVLTIVFWGWIARTPVWFEHAIPRSRADFVFMVSFYAYCATQTRIPVRTFVRLHQQETTVTARFRIKFLIVATASALLYFIFKLGLAIVGYLQFPTGLLLRLSQLSMAVGGTTWAIAFLPSRLLVGPLDYIETLMTMRDVEAVHARLTAVCPLVPEHSEVPFLRRAREPRLYTVLTIAHILDARKALALQLEQRQGAEQTMPEIRRWLQELRTLEGLSDTELVETCRTLKHL